MKKISIFLLLATACASSYGMEPQEDNSNQKYESYGLEYLLKIPDFKEEYDKLDTEWKQRDKNGHICCRWLFNNHVVATCKFFNYDGFSLEEHYVAKNLKVGDGIEIFEPTETKRPRSHKGWIVKITRGKVKQAREAAAKDPDNSNN